MSSLGFNTALVRSDVISACRHAARLDRESLMRIAVHRGCRHYAPLLPERPSSLLEESDLPHEVLGAALLQGPQNVATFQAIRCGAMVLSDLENYPENVVAAAEFFAVTDRVAHIARLGLEFDTHLAFWKTLLLKLPSSLVRDEFLPGLSRLTSETRLTRLGRHPAQVWLRTQWPR